MADKNNIKNIPIFIISFNRLKMLKNLIEFLENNNYTNINIIDNNSTYPELINYLNTLKYKVHYMKQNYGHKVFWDCGKFTDIINNEYYVVTDPDILPVENCPSDFLEKFFDILEKNLKFTKVGFSLKLDDIPDYYKFKNQVIEWEQHFYDDAYKYEDFYIYNADIDTTFALYRPNKNIYKYFGKAIRTGYPYQIRHLPWYLDENNLDEETIFYNKNCINEVTTWNTKFSNEDVNNRISSYMTYKNKFIENIFSIKNEYINYKKYKIIRIFGLKIKFIKKDKIKC